MLVEAFGEEFYKGDWQALFVFMVADECLDPKKGKLHQKEICRLFKLALLREQAGKRAAGKLKEPKRRVQTEKTRFFGQEEEEDSPAEAPKKKEGKTKISPEGGGGLAVPSPTREHP